MSNVRRLLVSSTALKFRVTDSPRNMHRTVVTCDNAPPESREVRENIRKRGGTRDVDLRGGRRSIRTIEFWYDTKGILNGRAEVIAYGQPQARAGRHGRRSGEHGHWRQDPGHDRRCRAAALPLGAKLAELVKLGKLPVQSSGGFEYNFDDDYVAPEWVVTFSVKGLFPVGRPGRGGAQPVRRLEGDLVRPRLRTRPVSWKGRQDLA